MNSFLLYIMATKSHFRTSSGILVSFMAFNDLLTICVSIPTYVANQVAVVRSVPPSCPLYILHKTNTVILVTITILLLAAVSFDRYLLAGNGTKEPNWKLKRTYKVLFLTIWIITLAAVILAFSDLQEGSSDNGIAHFHNGLHYFLAHKCVSIIACKAQNIARTPYSPIDLLQCRVATQVSEHTDHNNCHVCTLRYTKINLHHLEPCIWRNSSKQRIGGMICGFTFNEQRNYPSNKHS